MATLLRSVAGSVFLERIDGPQYMSVSGIPIFSSGSILLNEVTIARQESLQHIKTMTNNVFTYAFGELPGQVRIGGVIIFIGSCGQPAGSLATPNSYFSSHRAYRGRTSVIGVGGASFKVCLSGLQFSATAGPFPHGKFSLYFTLLPRQGG